MDQHNATPDTQERSSVGRRTVLKGAAGVAWTVPTVVALGTTVAAAGSFGTLAITDSPPYIFRGNFSGSYAFPNTPPTPTYTDGGNVTAVTISGTSPKINQDQTIKVTVTSSGGGTPVTGFVDIAKNVESWSVTSLNLLGLADGTLTFVASSLLAPLVNPSPSVTRTKDTVAPKPTISYAYFRPNQTPAKTLRVTTTLGSATSDLSTATLAVTVAGTLRLPATTISSTGDQRDFSSVEPSKTVSSTVVQSDAAGNKTTTTVTWTTPS